MTDSRRHPRDDVYRTLTRHVAYKIRVAPLSAPLSAYKIRVAPFWADSQKQLRSNQTPAAINAIGNTVMSKLTRQPKTKQPFLSPDTKAINLVGPTSKRHFPSSVHKRIVMSREPVRIPFPSGEKHIEVTQPR